MTRVSEDVVVWEYIRWQEKYQHWQRGYLLKTPNFQDHVENRLRWQMLSGEGGFPGDQGQVGRIRYYPNPLLPPYSWDNDTVTTGILQQAFLNYTGHNRQLLPLDSVARAFLGTNTLPFPFSGDNTRVVHENLRRLNNQMDLDDFNAIIFCRPTPGLPQNAYRIVEGTKRAIAYRIAQLQRVKLSPINGYFGNYP